MKYIIGICFGVGLSCAVSVVSNLYAFKVGDCVRELGGEIPETITYITKGGAIETNYTTMYSDKVRIATYENSNRLIKIECSK